jgi:hypothetical protein
MFVSIRYNLIHLPTTEIHCSSPIGKSNSKGEFIHQMEQLLQQMKIEPASQPAHSSSPIEPSSEEEEIDDGSIASS